jgi:hypothetical protein
MKDEKLCEGGTLTHSKRVDKRLKVGREPARRRQT